VGQLQANGVCQESFWSRETFVRRLCLGESMRKVDLNYRVICTFILGQRSYEIFVASLIFLIPPLLGAKPIPGNPAKVSGLNDKNRSIGSKQVTVGHGACIEERMPGH
jgi:hypothetical protein